MLRTAMALAAVITLTACGGADKGNETAGRKDEVRALDPNPPMSASDIDSIVNETRERDASRNGRATPPAAENASNTTN